MLQNQIDRANEKGWRREYPFLILLILLSECFLCCGNDKVSLSFFVLGFHKLRDFPLICVFHKFKMP